MTKPTLDHLENSGEFIGRHIGPSDADIAEMLKTIGAADLDEQLLRAEGHLVEAAADVVVALEDGDRGVR